MGRKFEVRKAAMAKTSLQKAKVYSRFGKELYMCAKQGGSNPEANLALKHLIEKAKQQQVPNDVIKRNIDKADKGLGEDYQAIRYEGFGPEGSCFLIDTLTDNVNRTVGEVRFAFTKMASKMGVKGSVEHLFEHLSFVTFKGLDEEAVLELLLSEEVDLQDIETENDTVTVTANGYAMDTIVSVLSAQESVEMVESEQGWFALEEIDISSESQNIVRRFLERLDELDEVSHVYHNVTLED